MAKLEYSDEQINNLIEGIYSGAITSENLPEDLYLAISDYLHGSFTHFEKGASKELLQNLSDNVYRFSGAKTNSLVNQISLVADNETVKSFKDFKNEALDIYGMYNENWLQTEYNTAILEGQNAVRWQQIEAQKETLPYLEYSAIVDANTAEICLSLNGKIAPVNDKFWDTFSPTQHFNCRCVLMQHDESTAKEIGIVENTKSLAKELEPLQYSEFKTNVGKTEQLFSSQHPYFEEATKEQLINNFGLPIPKNGK